MNDLKPKAKASALIPFIIFLAVFLGTGIVLNASSERQK